MSQQQALVWLAWCSNGAPAGSGFVCIDPDKFHLADPCQAWSTVE